jgi:hypothetical protein
MRREIQAVVMSAGAPASRALGQWLSLQGLAWRYGSRDYGLDHARNQNVRRFLADDAGKDWLLLIDHDMVPTDGTAEILAAPWDLCYCGYADRFGTRGHYGDGNFGAGCCRLSRKLLYAMRDPWFKTTYRDGCRTACECLHFRYAAAEAGYSSHMTGVIGHEQRCVILPDPDSAGGFALHWPPEYEDRDD